jgi:outer membrane lipoprotein SlyB
MGTTATKLALAGLATGLLGTFALAQGQPARIRGTIERVEGSTVTVKSRDGAEMKVDLPSDATVVGIVKSSLADVKQGSFVGVTGMPQPDGSQKALEIHIFPDAMRGTGEGHRPWDLQAQSTMTNASVEQTVASVDGQMLMVKYKDGEKKIVVTPETPIVTYAPGDRSELKPGVKVFVNRAEKQPDGSYKATRINYGKDGLTPPM